MAKMADEGLFCTHRRYLLSEKCTKGKDCSYHHIPKSRVSLQESIPNGADSVKGTLLESTRSLDASKSHNGHTSPASDHASNQHIFSHQKCLYSSKRGSIPSLNNHNNNSSSKKWDMKLRAKMDCQHPSTSDDHSASAASALSHTFDDAAANAARDDECLGAVALSATTPDSHRKRNTNTSAANNNHHHHHHHHHHFHRHQQYAGSVADKQWNLNAPEFVPRTRFNSTSNSEKRLCPFAERDGFCKYPPGECTYLHGDVCELCTKPALHPYNEELRKKHTQDCIKRHERDMEHAFAVARSKEKVCGICFEVIMQKNTEEQRFGILPSCNHCFCLTCIRRWRQSKQFENKIIRSCPECRIPSDFVCPSAYWVDTKEDKHKVIEKYKSALAKKDCKYFRLGRGHCPFGNKCFYRHCLQNGKKVDVGPPPSTNGVVGNAEALIVSPGSVEIIQNLLSELVEICPFDSEDDSQLEDIWDTLGIYLFLANSL